MPRSTGRVGGGGSSPGYTGWSWWGRGEGEAGWRSHRSSRRRQEFEIGPLRPDKRPPLLSCPARRLVPARPRVAHFTVLCIIISEPPSSQMCSQRYTRVPLQSPILVCCLPADACDARAVATRRPPASERSPFPHIPVEFNHPHFPWRVILSYLAAAKNNVHLEDGDLFFWRFFAPSAQYLCILNPTVLDCLSLPERGASWELVDTTL